MKKPLLFLAAGALLFSAACNKDTPNPASYIIGKWQTQKTVRTLSAFGLSYQDSTFPSDCQLDNFTAYELEGKGYNSGGSNLCAGEVPVASFSYVYDLHQQIIRTSSTQDTLHVKMLTPTNLVYIQARNFDTLGLKASYATEVYMQKLP